MPSSIPKKQYSHRATASASLTWPLTTWLEERPRPVTQARHQTPNGCCAACARISLSKDVLLICPDCSCTEPSVFLTYPNQQRHASFDPFKTILSSGNTHMVTHNVVGRQATTCHTSTAPKTERLMHHVVRRNLIRAQLIRHVLCAFTTCKS